MITLQYLIHHQPVSIEYNLIRKCEGPLLGMSTGEAPVHVLLQRWGLTEVHTQVWILQNSRADLTSLAHIPYLITSRPRSDTLDFILYYTAL